MPKYQIRGALGGGFGGVENVEWETIEAENMEEAQDEAYRVACETYDSYDGLYGLRSVSMIEEEEGVDESEAEEIWAEEREAWLDYDAREYVNEEEDEE